MTTYCIKKQTYILNLSQSHPPPFFFSEEKYCFMLRFFVIRINRFFNVTFKAILFQNQFSFSLWTKVCFLILAQLLWNWNIFNDLKSLIIAEIFFLLKCYFVVFPHVLQILNLPARLGNKNLEHGTNLVEISVWDYLQISIPTLVTHSVCPVRVFRHVPVDKAHTFTVKSAEPLTRISSSSL